MKFSLNLKKNKLMWLLPIFAVIAIYLFCARPTKPEVPVNVNVLYTESGIERHGYAIYWILIDNTSGRRWLCAAWGNHGITMSEIDSKSVEKPPFGVEKK